MIKNKHLIEDWGDLNLRLWQTNTCNMQKGRRRLTSFKYGTTWADQTAQTQYSVKLKLITVAVKDTEVSIVYQLLAVSKSTNRYPDPAGVRAEAHLHRNWLHS